MKRIFNFNANENNLRIAVFTDKIIRITYGKDTDVTSRNMVITADFDALPAVPVTESETEREYSLSTSAVKVNIDKKTLDLRFERADGSLLSGLYGHSLEEYEVYSTVGGTIETKQTVDGLRANLEGGETLDMRWVAV